MAPDPAVTTNSHIQLIPVTMLRRVLAVVIDFLVIYMFAGIVAGVAYAVSVTQLAGWGVPLYFLLVDLPLTAVLGLSVGRMAAGIRVVRLSDGRAPGLSRAALRIGLVVTTGPFGLIYWNFIYGIAHFWGTSIGPFRLWWDWAAGTAFVRSTRWGAPPEIAPEDLARL